MLQSSARHYEGCSEIVLVFASVSVSFWIWFVYVKLFVGWCRRVGVSARFPLVLAFASTPVPQLRPHIHQIKPWHFKIYHLFFYHPYLVCVTSLPFCGTFLWYWCSSKEANEKISTKCRDLLMVLQSQIRFVVFSFFLSYLRLSFIVFVWLVKTPLDWLGMFTSSADFPVMVLIGQLAT